MSTWVVALVAAIAGVLIARGLNYMAAKAFREWKFEEDRKARAEFAERRANLMAQMRREFEESGAKAKDSGDE